MKVKELIERLQSIPENTMVVLYDHEWGEFDEVVDLNQIELDVSYHKLDPMKLPNYLVFKGDGDKSLHIKIGEKTAVVLTV